VELDLLPKTMEVSFEELQEFKQELDFPK